MGGAADLLDSWFHFDLDLPGTNISELNDTVPLLGGDSVSYVNPDDEQIALHFLAISSLSRLITRVQEGIYQGMYSYSWRARCWSWLEYKRTQGSIA